MVMTVKRYDPASELGLRLTCHYWNNKRGFCGEELLILDATDVRHGRTHPCPRCGNRQRFKVIDSRVEYS